MSATEILLAILLGLLVNEACDLSPWAARKLVRWSALHRYTNPVRADVRSEEFARLIDERPGKLFKLGTALGFVSVAIMVITCRAIARCIPRKVKQRIKRIRPDLPASARAIMNYRTQDGLADYGFSIELHSDRGWRAYIIFQPFHQAHDDSLRSPCQSIDRDGRLYVNWPEKLDSLEGAKAAAALWAEFYPGYQRAQEPGPRQDR